MTEIAAQEIDSLITRMAEDLAKFLAQRGRQDYAMIGIHTGGVWIAERLYRSLAPADPLGHLNIAFYRDDFSRIGMHPSVEPSALPGAGPYKVWVMHYDTHEFTSYWDAAGTLTVDGDWATSDGKLPLLNTIAITE